MIAYVIKITSLDESSHRLIVTINYGLKKGVSSKLLVITEVNAEVLFNVF